jgi:DNA repair protein RecO (recombination protein O)
MSDIVKTEAVVLSKINYGDTSSIVSLYSESDGKISAIVKGGRTPKSKLGKIIDPLNHLQIIIYKKNSRDVQLLTSADLISHFVNIKSDYESTKYSFAILELVKNLTADSEANVKLFNGLIRILNLINDKKEQPAFLFGRFSLFYLEELGYEISIEKCSICGNKLQFKKTLGFNFEKGFVCSDCFESHSGLENISAELFKLINCLKTNITTSKFSVDLMDKFSLLLERYLKFHISDFKGIQSFQIYK